MKVYGIFKQMVLLPYTVETLENLYEDKVKASKIADKLNVDCNQPYEEDAYGAYSGTRYFVSELEILK